MMGRAMLAHAFHLAWGVLLGGALVWGMMIGSPLAVFIPGGLLAITYVAVAYGVARAAEIVQDGKRKSLAHQEFLTREAMAHELDRLGDSLRGLPSNVLLDPHIFADDLESRSRGLRRYAPAPQIPFERLLEKSRDE